MNPELAIFFFLWQQLKRWGKFFKMLIFIWGALIKVILESRIRQSVTSESLLLTKKKKLFASWIPALVSTSACGSESRMCLNSIQAVPHLQTSESWSCTTLKLWWWLQDVPLSVHACVCVCICSLSQAVWLEVSSLRFYMNTNTDASCFQMMLDVLLCCASDITWKPNDTTDESDWEEGPDSSQKAATCTDILRGHRCNLKQKPHEVAYSLAGCCTELRFVHAMA